MGIQALPQTTVRAIGASQVLTDPAAVVKELIDNALDAHATSFAVEIASNTLDVIQVRDNGHGIASADRPLVARRYCTSKILGEDDLRCIGGSSLGFRGEALASAAEMSGSLTISTRVEGEQVATTMKINQQGEVIGQERASLPVGTTVRLTDFSRTNPVRRQQLQKHTEKCLRKIKQTLQSYAFARPHVRMSLRVLKAKNDKDNWTYAPKPGGNAEDAAFKIVGAACASQCTWSVIEHQGFILHAFLPRAEADATKVSNAGAFLSIDTRPISAARGTPKQIAKIYREVLKKAGRSFDNSKDPFLFLEIGCPSDSYDANIEPAKDDVLFEDPDNVVEAARRLFSAVYPAQATASDPIIGTVAVCNSGASNRPASSTLEDDDNFVTTLERHQEQPAGASLVHQTENNRDDNATSSMRGTDHETEEVLRDRILHDFRSNMYGCDEEDVGLLDARPSTGRTEADFEELRNARKDITVSNPWVLAKLNTTLKRPATAQNEHLQQTTPAQDSDGFQLPQSSPVRQPRPQQSTPFVGLPTPRPSSPSPEQDFHPSDHVPDMRLARDGRLIGPPALPPPQIHAAPTPSYTHDASGLQAPTQRQRQRPAYDHNPPGLNDVISGTPLQAITDIGAKPRRSPNKRFHQGQINNPFVSPLVEGPQREKVWFDHLVDESPARQPKQRRQWQPAGSTGLVAQGELGDLIEDPRPITPPRRNRDSRDFVGSVDLTMSELAASMVENRNYPSRRRASSVDSAPTAPMFSNCENDHPTGAGLSGRGFIPASELAAMESRVGPLQHKIDTQRPPKRRKTSESRVMRQISGNAAINVDDEDYRPDTGIGKGASSRRKSLNKLHRTKSSRLPLERVPAGEGVHNLGFDLTTTSQTISRIAGKIDEEASLLGWNQPAVNAYDAFASLTAGASMNAICIKLHELLINKVSDGEMVQSLEELVRLAFEKWKTGLLSGEAE